MLQYKNLNHMWVWLVAPPLLDPTFQLAAESSTVVRKFHDKLYILDRGAESEETFLQN